MDIGIDIARKPSKQAYYGVDLAIKKAERGERIRILATNEEYPEIVRAILSVNSGAWPINIRVQRIGKIVE